jgi:hypothetical protein
MDWTKVVTDPLGLAGFALAVVFGVISQATAQRHGRDMQWIVLAGYGLAAVCVLGGLFIAYRRVSPDRTNQDKIVEPATASTTSTQPPAASTPSSMHIGEIKQYGNEGAAVAGVQGEVSVSPTQKEIKISQQPPAASTSSSIRIDKLEQHTTKGAAVAGVQGTVNVPFPQKESKPHN